VGGSEGLLINISLGTVISIILRHTLRVCQHPCVIAEWVEVPQGVFHVPKCGKHRGLESVHRGYHDKIRIPVHKKGIPLYRAQHPARRGQLFCGAFY
jgi:hypothetical protein